CLARRGIARSAALQRDRWLDRRSDRCAIRHSSLDRGAPRRSRSRGARYCDSLGAVLSARDLARRGRLRRSPRAEPDRRFARTPTWLTRTNDLPTRAGDERDTLATVRFAFLVLVGCGRIGFDALASDGATVPADTALA